MDLAIAGHVCSCLELVHLPGLVGVGAAGLGDEQDPGGDVPRSDPVLATVLPIRVESTRGEPGKVEGGCTEATSAATAQHHLLNDFQIGGGVLTTVVGEPGHDQGAIERGRLGYMDGLTVDRRPFPGDRNIFVVAGHVDDHADEWLAVVPQGDRDRHLRDAMDVVDRSVEGVDDPHPTGPPVTPSTLLTKHTVFGKVGGDHGPDGSLGVPIDLGDRVDGALQLGVQRLEEAGLHDVGSGTGRSDRYPNVAFPHRTDSIARNWEYSGHPLNQILPITRGGHTLLDVVAVLLALIGAVASVLAFPPFGPGLLIIPGIAMFLTGLRLVKSRGQGVLAGAVYGIAFFGGLMWWLAELELIALVLVPVQALFLAVYGWWLTGFRDDGPGRWLVLAVGSWGVMELIRYHFPVGGLEWGAAGYALSDNDVTRIPAMLVGTSGLTVAVVVVAAGLAMVLSGYSLRWLTLVVTVPGALLLGTIVTLNASSADESAPVAIVQGSTPCPFEHCPPNERLRTYEQHLELTRTIEQGTVDLVVWSEGSTGSTNADPVLNDEIREAIGAEARRIGAPFLVGGDRIIGDTEWINANVFFDSNGQIVDEYRKQHPVPFGEYVPLRPAFDWIPALSRVPRDMIRGDGPVVFPGKIGSVISFEGGFSRYALEHRRAGADVIIVATNEGSYGVWAPTSDQFIGMTRMRAVELGVPVIHAAVTGKSTVIDNEGNLTSTTGLGTREIFYGGYGVSNSTIYTTTGDLVMYLAAILGILVWSRTPSLVGSRARPQEED